MAVVSALVLALVLNFPGTNSTDQTSSNNPVFTITVAPPAAARDVQLRYFLTDQAGDHWASTAASAKDDKISIRAETGSRAPKSFSAIAYAAGCEFVTFTVEDLAGGPGQGDYQCRKLPTVELRGRITLPSPQQRAVDVEAMYVVRWAGKFFGVSGLSMSPLAVTKTKVETDGTFSMELPDFSADALWSSFSNDATLMFFLVDRETGHRIAGLRAPAALARNGNLKVSATYPEITFTIRQNRIAAKQTRTTP